MIEFWLKTIPAIIIIAIAMSFTSNIFLVDYVIVSLNINKILDIDLDDTEWVQNIGGSISNTKNSPYVFPNGELDMALSMTNILQYPITVHTEYYLETEDGIKTIPQQMDDFDLSVTDSDTIKTKFKTIDEGVHFIKFNFRIVNASNSKELGNFQDAVNFRVQPLSVQLQAANNETNFRSFIAAMIVGVATSGALIASIIVSRSQVKELKDQNTQVKNHNEEMQKQNRTQLEQTQKQLELSKKQIEIFENETRHKLRAWIGTTDSEKGFFITRLFAKDRIYTLKEYDELSDDEQKKLVLLNIEWATNLKNSGAVPAFVKGRIQVFKHKTSYKDELTEKFGSPFIIMPSDTHQFRIMLTPDEHDALTGDMPSTFILELEYESFNSNIKRLFGFATSMSSGGHKIHQSWTESEVRTA